MIATDVGRAALLATIPLAYALDALTLGQLYGVAFLAGALTVLFNVSDASLFVAIVPRERFVEASSLLNGSRAFSFVAGPRVAGVLVQALTAPGALLADALSFLGSGALLRAHRSRGAADRIPSRAASPSACAGSRGSPSSAPRCSPPRRSTSSTSSSGRCSSSTRRGRSTSRPARSGSCSAPARSAVSSARSWRRRVTRRIGVGPDVRGRLRPVPGAAAARAARGGIRRPSSSPASSSPSSARGSA